MHSRSSVRASHHIWRSAHQILMIFCTKLHLDESKKMFQADFWKKFSFGRFWPKTSNFCHFWPFLAKKSGFWTFSSNPQICLKLGQKLGTIALNHRMAVLCLVKFSFCLFWPFLVKNTLLVVTLYGFLAEKWPFEPISSKPRIRFWWFFTDVRYYCS